eukprot:m.152604 g.152604  ORF g.152604 m.152604 type:complete len:99 (-) comp16217_c2_seq2:1829-2125(-)
MARFFDVYSRQAGIVNMPGRAQWKLFVCRNLADNAMDRSVSIIRALTSCRRGLNSGSVSDSCICSGKVVDHRTLALHQYACCEPGHISDRPGQIAECA